jgi:uncharacterized repeat protein (TIGR03803 family)
MNNSTQHRRRIFGIHRRVAVAALAFVIVFVAAVVPTRSAQAQTFSVLYSFLGGTDGGDPEAGLVRDALSGNLYGTTFSGGAYGSGTVFKVDTTGIETVLYSFKGTPDGVGPHAGLVREGNLYGTTTQGGAYGYGTVFKVDKKGKETVLYSFTGAGGDGNYPYAGLVRDALSGNLYGTTFYGGTYLNYGTVFKVDKTGHETVLHSFTGGTDGGNPYAGLVRDALSGNLYGTTFGGGDLTCNPPTGCGTVFKVDATGNETVLYSFTGGTDGGYPRAGLVRDAKGNLYGTTSGGGVQGYGTVFKVDTTGTETVLYSFGATAGDGAEPWASLVRDAQGNLYGTTFDGGAYDYGTVFKVDKKGKETVLYSFTGARGDGYYPIAGLVRDALSGNLYGTTVGGGVQGSGMVFKLTP